MDMGGMGTMESHDHMMDNSTMTPGEHSMGGHHMAAYFFFSNESVILFLQWTTKDWKSLLYSCIGIAIVALLYEGLKNFREYLLCLVQRRQAYSKSCCTALCGGMHILQTFLHMIQISISYGLMLIFMTFNGWLCIAILVGGGLGYLIFGWKRHSTYDMNDHCN